MTQDTMKKNKDAIRAAVDLLVEQGVDLSNTLGSVDIRKQE